MDSPTPKNSTHLHPAIIWLVEELSSISSIQKISLFGSRARGDNAQKSDIDLAIYGNIPPKDWASMMTSKEHAPTLLDIDLVCWQDTDETLQTAIT